MPWALPATGIAAAATTPSATSTPNSNTSSATATGLKTTTVSGHKVLTNAEGFVVYWFAIDTPTKSNCNATCAANWPPLIGTPSLASGVTLTGKLGTIKRADGQMQATYEGHPLYLFKADTSAGEDSGNALNAAGGLWWAMTASGAKIKKAAAPASTSSPSGGGGYGY